MFWEMDTCLLNTGCCLIEVTTKTGFTVVHIQCMASEKNQLNKIKHVFEVGIPILPFVFKYRFVKNP